MKLENNYIFYVSGASKSATQMTFWMSNSNEKPWRAAAAYKEYC
jgi:hypothetical protein